MSFLDDLGAPPGLTGLPDYLDTSDDPFGTADFLQLQDPADILGFSGSLQATKDADAKRAAETLRQKNIQKAIDSVSATFAGYDDPYFQRVGADYTANQRPQLEDQYENARRSLLTQLSGGPGVGSSVGAKSLADLTERYYGGKDTIAAGAEDAMTRARDSISGLRRAFTEQARGGASIGDIGAQSVAALRDATAPPDYSPLADLFNTGAQQVAGNIYKDKQSYTGAPLTFGSGGSTSGTVVGG